MLAVLVAVVTTAPARPWAQLEFRGHPPPRLGSPGLGSDP